MSDAGDFVEQVQKDDYARGLDQDPPLTVEEELEREREGTFARGQEVLPEDTVEKDRPDSFARGQEVLPEDTEEKVREGTFAEGQEVFDDEPPRVEPGLRTHAIHDDVDLVEPVEPVPGNVRRDDEFGRPTTT